MQLSVSGKRLDVGDSLRIHVATTLGGAVDRYFGRAIEGKVVFERQRHLFRADISVHVRRGMVLQSHHEAADPYAAFDGAVERLDHRLKRHKGRIAGRKRGKQATPEETAFEPARYAVIEPEAETLADEPAAAPIVAEMTTEIATLSVGEAVARLDLGQKPVLMFRNKTNGELNVVYRRADAAIGWIDPGAGGKR
ncbi:MAG: ribosome-associated translation inhibitor RaiA [Rhodospirillales bacterium]|nr:ribosome-associated translation inhibitor RaiA [Rhodospirillales bacterium]